MANKNRTKIEPAADCDDTGNAETPAQEYQRPSPLNGISLPRPPKANRLAEKHGFNTMRNAITKLGARALDGRSSLGYALRRWRKDLVADLGGEDAISTQQAALVDLAVKSKLILDSIDAWLLVQPSLINKQKKTLMPVVIQRQQLADGLAKYMSILGLERRVKVKTLHDLLTSDAENDDKPAAVNGNGKADDGNDCVND